MCFIAGALNPQNQHSVDGRADSGLLPSQAQLSAYSTSIPHDGASQYLLKSDRSYCVVLFLVASLQQPSPPTSPHHRHWSHKVWNPEVSLTPFSYLPYSQGHQVLLMESPESSKFVYYAPFNLSLSPLPSQANVLPFYKHCSVSDPCLLIHPLVQISFPKAPFHSILHSFPLHSQIHCSESVLSTVSWTLTLKASNLRLFILASN